MLIHSLTIDNVRGIEHLELSDLPDTGVIVISGDNEQGKSTILDALHAVLNEKHSARNKVTRPLLPVGRDVSPAVSLTATLGSVTFTITKQWFRGKKAELAITTPHRENYTGEEAEQKLAQLKDDHLDDTLLQSLFLRQGDLAATISAAGIPSLTSALDGAGEGETASTGEDSALLSAVEKEYTRYFTASKAAEAGLLKAARAAHEAAAEELAGANSEVAELTGFVTRVESVTRERDEAKNQLPDARTEVTDLGEKAERAADSREKATRLREELDRAEQALNRAEQAVTARKQMRTELAELEAELTERSRGLAEAEERAEQEERQLSELSAQLEQARQQEETARQAVKEANARHRLLADVARRDELSAWLSDVDDLDARIRALHEQSAGPQIEQQDLEQVEEAATELTLQRRLREAASAKLHLSATTPTTVTVGGREIELGTGDHPVELADGTTLVAGAVTAVYSAGHGADTTDTDAVATAQAHLAELLEELECADVEAVRTAHEKARRSADERAALTRERNALVREAEVDTLRAELTRLDSTLAEADVSQGSDLEQADRAVETATEALDGATDEVSRLDSALTPWRERNATTALTRLSTQIEGDQAAAERARRALRTAEDEAPGEELERDIDTARRIREEAAARVAEAERALEQEDPDLAVKVWEGARAHLESLEKTVTEAERKLAELTGRIEQATGAAERLEKATAAEEAAAHRLASIERRAVAARVLRETLHRHRDEARRRYAQPFAEQLTRLARTVFGPDVEFTLSDDLEVETRSIGDTAVPLESLSGGAREQLAILTRFAIANLVSREGPDGTVPVPVVIDDALGSTDPSRLQLMATLFSDMGRTGQVMVLTCVPQRYSRVTDRTEYRIEELKTGGALS